MSASYGSYIKRTDLAWRTADAVSPSNKVCFMFQKVLFDLLKQVVSCGSLSQCLAYLGKYLVVGQVVVFQQLIDIVAVV